MRSNVRTFQITWGDCDPGGIVFYPRFFEHFDACTAALFASAGIDIYRLQKRREIAGIPMVDLRARFAVPVHYGDEVVVESAFAAFGRSSFEVRHRLHKGGELAVEVFETRVWTGPHPDDPSRLQARPIPDEVKERFRRGEDAP
jgi:4-hydroxybenzoyl-CoA thioesterase